MKRFALMFFAIVLAACASPPFKLDGVNRNISPAQARGNDQFLNQRVVWGGMIVETRPLGKQTQIEVLAYPLNESTTPIRSAQNLGRFILIYNGFLEPAEFASGRWLSAKGIIQAGKSGTIGDAEYQYAVLKAEEIHLWSEETDPQGNTRFHFGIGIGIRL